MRKNLDTLVFVGVLTMAATPLMGLASLAHAQEFRAAPAYIFVADLDFTRRADVAKFRQRVNAAAGPFCAQADATNFAAVSACRQALQAEAVEQLGSDQRRGLESPKL